MAPKFTLATEFLAIDKLSGPMKTMEKNAGHMGGVLHGAFDKLKGLIAGAAAGLAIGEIAKGIKEFAEKGDEIARTSQALGMSATNLQRLQYAAKMTDVPAETLTGALRKMSVNLGELSTRQGALYTHLSRTNPALARQLYETKDNGKAFSILVDAINHTSNAQERAALTVAAFGKSGQELLPMIMKGSKGMADMGDEADRLGLIMGNNTVKAGQKLHDGLKLISAAGEGLKNRVLGMLVEKLAPVIEKFALWATTGDNLVHVIPYVAAGIGVLAVVWAVLNAVMMANPMMLIAMGLIALGAAVVFVIAHWKEITAWINRAWTAIKNFAMGIFNTVIPYVKAFGETLMKYWLIPLNLVVDAVRGVLWLLSKIPGIGAPFKGALDAVTSGQNAVNSALTGTSNQFGFGDIAKNALGSRTINKNSKSTVDVNFHNMPAASITQRGAAPGITLNPGWAVTK